MDPTADGRDALRDETPTQRLDRNWSDLLQELRAIQTGVQLLTGFLLTLPFQTRFGRLTVLQRDVYLATVAAAVLATALLLAPVSVHRFLFRRHERAQTVAVAHRLAMAGLVSLAVAIVGVVFLVFALIVSTIGAWVASALTVVVLFALWVVLPTSLRR